MMKQHYDMPQGLTEQIPLVEDQNCYLNYHQFDSHKMTDPEEDSLEEGSQEEEDFQKEVEDFPEVEDTLEEAGVPLAPDHQEVDGAHHPHLYHKVTMENWSEKHPPPSMEIESKRKCSSTNGYYTGVSTMTMR